MRTSMGLKERLLGVGANIKRPTLVIYWADTLELLTHVERLFILSSVIVVDVTPLEVLLQEAKSGRKIVVRGITDEHLPHHLNGFEG